MKLQFLCQATFTMQPTVLQYYAIFLKSYERPAQNFLIYLRSNFESIVEIAPKVAKKQFLSMITKK